MSGRQAPEAGAAPVAAGDVLTFGETMVALRGSGPLKLGGAMQVSIAGAESNVAIGLARLGHAVRWAGAVGDDEAGELVLRTLRAEGVDVSGALHDPQAPTGLILFEPRLPEVTRVHYYRAGSAGSRLAPDTIEQAFAQRAPRVLHLTGITPALSPSALAATRRALELARAHRSLICLDVNFRARLWSAEAAGAVLRSFVPHVDVLIASEDELPLCLPPDARHAPTEPAAAGATADSSGTGPGSGTPGGLGEAAEQAEFLLAQGIDQVVVKLGADGAVCHTSHGAVRLPARSVRAVDTVGAGDAFVAGYLSGLLDGEDTTACLDRAVTTGAFAVASAGDWEGAPTRAELGLLGSTPGTVIR
ncbi:sugar kinase [Streptomyces odontomachi]|uniref:sugar kinase n=1 Tax=Streptomyces odontomachi TaxID=2944940 RepID=UPI00210C2C08|nr:sugar kinase [Streptomyces sp. ODS25]